MPGDAAPDVIDGASARSGAALRPHSRPTRRSRLSSAARRLPPALVLILVVHVLLLLFYTALFPNYRGPDEPLHVDLIASAADGDAVPWPAPGTYKTRAGVGAGGFITNGRIAVRQILPADQAPARGDRPSYNDAGGTTPGRFPNQLVQHPPLYYYATAPLLAAVPGWQDQPLDRLVGLLRLVNVLLLAPLPLLIYYLAIRVGLVGPTPVAAAGAVLAVPQLHHIGSAVNNDNLLVLLLALMSLLVARVARGDVRRRTAATVGLVMGLALLTKGLALFLPLLVGLGYVVAASRTSLRRVLLPGALAMTSGFAVGGWWWLRNRLLYGTFQPNGTQLEQAQLTVNTSFGETGVTWLKMFVKLVNQRFWLEPGITTLSQALQTAVLSAACVTLLAVLAAPFARELRRADAFLLVVPVICLLGIVAFGSWSTWEKVIRPAGMQGRYLYGGLPSLAVLAAAGAARGLGRRWAPGLPLAVFLAGLVMQTIMIWSVLGAHWLPVGGNTVHRLGKAGENMTAWSPWPTAAVVLVTVTLVIAILATAVVMLRELRTTRPA